MKNIQSVLNTCEAGLDFKANTIDKTPLIAMLYFVSDSPIDTSHSRSPHLLMCIKQCESISGLPIYADTYNDILNNMEQSWESISEWTWTYRILNDILEMDEHCNAAFNGCTLTPLRVRRARPLAWVSRGRALGQISDVGNKRYKNAMHSGISGIPVQMIRSGKRLFISLVSKLRRIF